MKISNTDACLMVGAMALLLYAAFSDDAKAADAPPAPNPCAWPAKLPIALTPDQIQAILTYSEHAQDSSHAIWLSIATTLTPQINDLVKKYCPAPK